MLAEAPSGGERKRAPAISRAMGRRVYWDGGKSRSLGMEGVSVVGAAALAAAVLLSGCDSRVSSVTREMVFVLRICDSAGATSRPDCASFMRDPKAVQSQVVFGLETRAAKLPDAQTEVHPLGGNEVEIRTTAPASLVLPLVTTGSIAFATAVPGDPDPTSATFVGDQVGRFDAAQFGNPTFYPPGFHWKIDPKLAASDVTSASAGTDPNTGQIAMDITFNSAGAEEWSKITQAAYDVYTSNPSSPQAQVAIFLDNDVLSAPDVVQGGQSNNTQVTGNFTTASATAIADAIASGALPAEVSVVSIDGKAPSPTPSVHPASPSIPTPLVVPTPHTTPQS
jgi:hypothetical protein